MRTVVLLSGGLDSAVTLAQRSANGDEVHALTVDYGQSHKRELQSAKALAKRYGVEHTVVEIDPVLFRGSALTGEGEIPEEHALEPDATYVPGRNTVLLSLAASKAESIDASAVVIGVNAGDAAGYPDCRPEFIYAMRDVLQRGTKNHVWLMAPLLFATKMQILSEARALGVPVELTWSCYRGGDVPCNSCGACRALGAVV